MFSRLVRRAAGVAAAFALMTGAATASPNNLYVSGNQILDNGNAVKLKGVNVSGLEFTNSGGSSDPNTLAPTFQSNINSALNTFNSRLIRLPLCQDRWIGQGGTDDWGAPNYSSSYWAFVDGIVNQASNANAYVLLECHWSDMGTWGSNFGQHNFCDWNTNYFWSQIAARYANNPAVIFGLYNEPHDLASDGNGAASWNIWKNGGQITEQYHGATYQYWSPGQQTLVNTIRGTGAHNLIVAGGLDWAYDLRGLTGGSALSDPGGNGIAYDVHIYYFTGSASYKSDPANWNTEILPAAKQYPVLAGEFGVYTLTSNQPGANWIGGTLLPWVSANLSGGTAWTCNNGDPSNPLGTAGFVLDLNNNVTPYGAVVQNWIATDPQLYSFETGTQGWKVGWGTITGLTTGTKAFGGSRALSFTVGGTNQYSAVSVANPAIPAGKTVSAQVWVPSGSNVFQVEGHVYDKAGKDIGHAVFTHLKTNSWNKVAFATLKGSAAAGSLAYQFDQSKPSAWSGTCLLDCVSTY